MPSENDQYLIKLKTQNIPNKMIAAKLGMTEDEVEQRWVSLVSTASSLTTNGYAKLAELFNNIALQYQSLGQGVNIMGGALANPCTESELIDLMSATPQESARNILANCIVLRRFTAPNPDELLAQMQNPN